MTAILVTGGAGFIGSHVCKELAKRDFTPVVYDNLCRGFRHNVKWGPFEHGNIEDQARLEEVIARYQPVAVMHFAAYAYVGESVAQPWLYYRNNIAGSLSLLDAMRVRKVPNLIVSSTCATYGIQDEPITEALVQTPINPYGFSKLALERIIQDYATATGMNWLALRYFNAAGSDPDLEIGEEHDPEPHLIPRAMMAAEGSIPALQIFGTDWPTPDGTCVRDYIHLADLASAHVAGLEYLLNGGDSIALNLGNGQGYSIMDIIKSIGEVTGKDVPWNAAPRRAGDVPSLISDATLAKKTIGFANTHGDINQIIHDAWAWRRKRFG